MKTLFESSVKVKDKPWGGLEHSQAQEQNSPTNSRKNEPLLDQDGCLWDRCS